MNPATSKGFCDAHTQAVFRSGTACGLALALVALLSLRTFGAEPESLARLDQALTAATNFEYGKDSAPLETIEQIVFAAAQNPAQARAVEERLLRTLNSPATRDVKEFVCRQLFTIGSDRSIPALEALLTDAGLAHMARYALERNESPEASAALLHALSRTSGELQTGVLNSLGRRHYAPAVPEIKTVLSSQDPLLTSAAAAALGDIGGSEAVKALQTASEKTQGTVQLNVKAALLACGEKFLAEHNEAAAWRLYKTLLAPGQPTTIRIAALRGLLLARNDKAIAPLVAAIRSPDATLSAGAIGVSRFGRGPAITKALAQLLPSLSYPKQELLLRALEARREPAAMEAVITATGSDNEAVRTAACAALGTVGDDSVAELLTRMAANARGAEQQTARASLTQLERGNVNGAIVRCLSGAEPAVQIEAARALASRRATLAFNELLQLATDRNETLRREAFRALGLLANQQNLPSLVKLTANLSEPEDLAWAEQALTGAFQRLRDPEKLAAPVLAELRNAPDRAQPTLLALLSQAPTSAGLTAVRALLNEEYPAVYEGVIRSLADWPNAAPAEDLLNVVRTAPRPAHKAIALRGYVRMAGLGTNAGAMYARALEVAERPEDKRLVIGSLGAAEPEQAFKLVEPYLKDEQLHAEAAQALVQIAERFRPTDAVRAKAILKEVLGSTTEATVCQQAREVLNQIEPYEAHILQWVGSGPYQDKDKDARILFDTVFPPEKSDATDVKWTALASGIGTWDIDLSQALGGGDDVVAYVRTRVWSSTAQEVRLELGSDDGIKVWLNGSVIHANNVERGMAPRQDTAKAGLKEGWNDLLLKVTNRGGGWGFSCRIRQPDGSALDGLKYEPR